MNLKRTIIVCLTCLVAMVWTKQADAQDQRFRFGMKFSGNLSWISPVTSNIESTGSGVGFSYGIMGDFNFQDYYSFSTELLFTTISGGIKHTDLLHYTPPDSGGRTSHQNIIYDYKFKYVQIPASIKFKTKQMGYITYWAQFGLAPSFLMEAKADISGRTPFDDDDPTDIRVNKAINDKYHFEEFDDNVLFVRLPLIVGAGIEYSLAGNTSLYTGLRIDNNFLQIFNKAEFTSAKNSYVGLNVGIFF